MIDLQLVSLCSLNPKIWPEHIVWVKILSETERKLMQVKYVDQQAKRKDCLAWAEALTKYEKKNANEHPSPTHPTRYKHVINTCMYSPAAVPARERLSGVGVGPYRRRHLRGLQRFCSMVTSGFLSKGRVQRLKRRTPGPGPTLSRSRGRAHEKCEHKLSVT